MTERRWTVSDDDAGMRLDVALTRWAGLSRRQARQCLQRGWVSVGGRIATAADKGRVLLARQEVQLLQSPSLLEEPVASADLEPSVIGCSGDWIAIDKPAGVGVHPLDSRQRETVLNGVIRCHPEIVGVGEGGLRSGVIHRLDVDTSGVLLMALTQPGFDRLRPAFAEHRVRKTYWALVEGELDESGEVDLALRMRRHRPALVEVADDRSVDARCCRTRWQVLERRSNHALVEVQPTTGHLHQIRVTFAYLGAPIVGDAVYGQPVVGLRHMLHARALEFEEIGVQAPAPADFVNCQQELGFG